MFILQTSKLKVEIIKMKTIVSKYKKIKIKSLEAIWSLNVKIYKSNALIAVMKD